MTNSGRKCIVCGNDKLTRLLTLENMPALAQNMPGKDELDNDKPLVLDLCQCDECGLVQFDIDPVYYYKDVIRAGGGTTTMRRLRHEEYSRLLDWMRKKNLAGRDIVEIGCGKGEFLGMWQDLDDAEASTVNACGIEHDSKLVDIARNNGLNVYNTFAEGDVKYSDVKYDAFVQFNFLEHQPDPSDMLRNIWSNLKDEALGLVTVPSFEYILENDGYYELMRDHIAYYTFESMSYVFESNGFKVLESRMVNRDTIELIVEKNGQFEKAAKAEFKAADVSALIRNYKDIKDVIQNHIKELDKESKKMAIWGASHQTFTLAATTDLKGKVSYIIDSADFKQGKYSPVSQLQIVSPDYFLENPVDEILIIAPGYTDEISGIIKERYGEDVRILVLKDKSIRDYKTNEEL